MSTSLSRRHFLSAAVAAAGGAAAFSLIPRGRLVARSGGPIELPPLPYADDALDPVISARTLGFHYGKHHAGYVRKLNASIQGTEWAEWPLEKIVRTAAKDTKNQGIFNNAAQVWNHSFYWKSMRPEGGGKPKGALLERLEKSFGSFEKFREKLITTSGSQFGSGWGWLVETKSGKLAVLKTGNADLPLVHGQKPLLCVDVWEHAYYLDYQNERKAYLEAFMDKLVNWDFAAENLG